ncbi:DUF1289 domain-containing protein [Vibrio algivorus]|uniref:DUF1289 domain-containing protein n=1 Tax=Vibrio algivorus TaxID=1667024 RepID=A0A557PEL2_9VIBR|nr:DUF1289 domain-containing protein [Vibrio algivorus]TVO39083.1 DUF1289 domain-containing protein [Vibrio algivorus]GLT15923.1 DUF1289 domain-containing protein [Vibrio algivorus]
MEQLEFFSVPSPCVGVCTVDEKGYCQGCMRKREERFNWLNFTPAQQRHIIKLCKQRYYRKRLAQRNVIPVTQVDNEEDLPPQGNLF